MKRWRRRFRMILLSLLAALIAAFCFSGCSPVKRVIRDPHKLDIVAREVIRRGYCVNDTVTRIHDSLIQGGVVTIHDSVLLAAHTTPGATQASDFDIVFPSGVRVRYNHDQVSVWYPNSETIRIRTVTRTLVDNAHIHLLQGDSALLSVRADSLRTVNHTLKVSLRKARIHTILLISGICLVALWKFFRKIKSLIPGLGILPI